MKDLKKLLIVEPRRHIPYLKRKEAVLPKGYSVEIPEIEDFHPIQRVVGPKKIVEFHDSYFLPLKTIEKMKPHEVIHYLSAGQRELDKEIGLEVKDLSKKYGFGLTFAGCACDFKDVLDFSSEQEAYFMLTSCGGGGLDKIAFDFLKENPSLFWKLYPDEKLEKFSKEGGWEFYRNHRIEPSKLKKMLESKEEKAFEDAKESWTEKGFPSLSGYLKEKPIDSLEKYSSFERFRAKYDEHVRKEVASYKKISFKD